LPQPSRRNSEKPFEGPAERGLGLIPETPRHLSDPDVFVLEPRPSDVHSEARHVVHDRLADEIGESRRESQP